MPGTDGRKSQPAKTHIPVDGMYNQSKLSEEAKLIITTEWH